MNTITHNLIGEEAHAVLVGDPGVPGWSDTLVVQGSKRTMIFGLQTIPGSNEGPDRKLFVGHFFEADTRSQTAQNVAKIAAEAITDAGWQEDLLRSPISAFGADARMSREGWIRRDSGAIPVNTPDGKPLGVEAWEPLLAGDVVCSDKWLRQSDILSAGGRVEDGALAFDPERAKLMAPIVQNHPVLGHRHFPKIEDLASDLERGNDEDSVIARHFDCSRKCAKAMRTDALQGLGVDLADGRSMNQIIGHLPHVPDASLPKRAEDVLTLLAVADFAQEAQGRGLRKDAPEAFVAEASGDWDRAATALRTAGAFTAADPIWEAVEDIGSGAPTADMRRSMSLAPGIGFRETTHLCRAFNEKTFAARYSTKGIPEVFPEHMSIEGGRVSEVLHGNAIATLGLAQGTRKTRELWRKVAPKIEIGDSFAFAVHDEQGAPIGAIILDSQKKKMTSLPARGATRDSDKALLARGQAFIESTILGQNADKLAERRRLVDGQQVKARVGQLQHRVDARKKSRTEGIPLNWALAEADLPPSLRKLGPEGFAAHYQAIKISFGLAEPEEQVAKQMSQDVAR